MPTPTVLTWRFTTTSSAGLKAIEVADNGHGIPYAEAEDFVLAPWRLLENRRAAHVSHEKRRILHGKEGRGRFRAFGLGRVVDWHVCYAANRADCAPIALPW